ncbi:unnamed protein product [Nippostrongylus brasiliensis]|uniref:Uncharacterized protein n=1 Tax=Nippostrongylus brasiliensis TaxID=27835 RepID=A0A0N4XQN0_NIPBR|nr:unnamed protein product [Nippostrongylus brasiliensis]
MPITAIAKGLAPVILEELSIQQALRRTSEKRFVGARLSPRREWAGQGEERESKSTGQNGRFRFYSPVPSPTLPTYELRRDEHTALGASASRQAVRKNNDWHNDLHFQGTNVCIGGVCRTRDEARKYQEQRHRTDRDEKRPPLHVVFDIGEICYQKH